MEATPEHIAGLTHYLSQTLNPTTRKQAETALATVESQPNFPVLLLKLVEDPSTDPTVRFAGVIYFKNFVKRCWVQNGEQDVITAADRAAIKTHIVTLMRAVPASLQAQLGEAVSIIADNDFPDNWMNLIPDLTSKLSADDHVSNIGILQTAHSIFRRYRGMTRTDKLFLEIKLVLSTFAQPYLEFLKIVDQAIEANKDNGPVLQNLFQVLLQIVKIFYDLNYQDLPEFFEDHQSEFMVLFQKYLSYTNPLLSTGDDDEVGSLEKVKATICESLDLYAKKYAEEFTHLPDFVTVVWNLLTTTGLEPKNDILVSKAIGFLTSVVQPSQYRSLFQDPDTLRNICERVVLPNMQLRDSDEELFEDDPIEFIRRDLEGSDTNTRRRAASELVRGLLEHFASEVTGIFSQYVALNLQNYEKNPKSNWKSKDTALFLITSLSARSSTAQAGVTKVNEFMEVLPLFTQHILPELQTAANGASHPIITVDAIKFLMVFRSQLTKEQLSSVFPYLLNHLGSSNYVVYTYAAVCIERILATKLPNGAFQFHEGDIATVAYPILQHLLGLIERNGVTPEKLAENDYLMKTAMRITIVAKHDLEPNAIDIVKRLTQVIEIISKNPSNPKFNHYVFESLAATIRFICARKPQLVNDFEALLFPPFEAIISSGTDEFMPYVFQILSQMLTLHPSGSQLPPTYASMIQPLLMPALWNAHGNVPALVRLLRSYLEKTPGAFTEGTLLGQVLGVCHKLIGSRVDDHFGFELLQGVFEFIPMATIRQYLNNIFVLLFTRLSHAKTTKYTRGMLTFFSFLFVLEKTGLTADTVVGAVDSVQGQPLFNNLLEKVLIPELTSMLSIQERKMAVVGLSRCLKTSTIMRTPPYTNVRYAGCLVCFLPAKT
ncbi:Cse1-domain-containing protein [Phlyctochytrium arcticum]|nr:Cse1-domain-containing protein [Phlyctochytrium arcticum]